MDVHDFPTVKKASSSEPFLLSKASPDYVFEYSTKEDVAGKKSRCRIATVTLLILATIVLPVAILIDKADD